MHNTTQQQISEVEARRAAAVHSVQAREAATHQAEADKASIEKADRELAQLRTQESHERAQALLPDNMRLITDYDVLVRELYARLDTLEVLGSDVALAALEAAFIQQQDFKRQIVSLYHVEFEAAAANARRQSAGIWGDGIREGIEASQMAYRARFNSVPNALTPEAVLLDYVAEKQGPARRQAVGLVYALVEALLIPTPDFNAAQYSNQQINAAQRY